MTPNERERRIEAAVRSWIAGTKAGDPIYSQMRAALGAADEAVPMVSLAAVLDVLDRAYHPQMGENPTHPADVIRASFSGEEGTEG